MEYYSMENIELIHGGNVSDVKQTEKTKEVDMVNRPPHYTREDAMECIDEMELIFGVEAVKNFCLCNAWKYRYRAADKNGAEDIAKSDWYIRKYKELCDNKTNSLPYISVTDSKTSPWVMQDPITHPYVTWASKVDN